ncbi:hypothetical protein N7466_005732 [Penicillium verhagenii]|uniref:uncharacterized protein n=1 Tax=Penicillium verhagenii TaxID=1562060 RepID=UPI002544F8B1|nr:uncharacterized protein N7466_005732 [Penicillium verhagenii]KAJ5930239.1 hypothetical protein N7466_005732 [Penicillium verhagenii]
MQFKLALVSALFAASAIAVPVASSQASCSQSVVAALNGATKEVSDLNSNLSGTTNAASLAAAIISGFADNMATLLSGIVLPCDYTLSSQDQQDICDAATTFIDTDKALVSTVSNKANILSASLLSVSVHAAINNLEVATTNYLRPIINNMSICGGSIQSELTVLESKINSAVAAF